MGMALKNRAKVLRFFQLTPVLIHFFSLKPIKQQNSDEAAQQIRDKVVDVSAAVDIKVVLQSLCDTSCKNSCCECNDYAGIT